MPDLHIATIDGAGKVLEDATVRRFERNCAARCSLRKTLAMTRHEKSGTA